MIPLHILIPIAGVVIVALIMATRGRTPKGLLVATSETLDPVKRNKKAKANVVRLRKVVDRVKERVQTYRYEISLYVDEPVIPVVVLILVIAGLACDGADTPLQLTFWGATLSQGSSAAVWSLATGSVSFLAVATFVALVVPALWTTMVPTWKRRSIVVSVFGGVLVALSLSALGAVRFVGPTMYAYLKNLTFWAQVILTEGLPITAGALHATAFLYGRPLSVTKKKAALDRYVDEIEKVIVELEVFVDAPKPTSDTNLMKGEKGYENENVTVPADFLVGHDVGRNGVR